MTCVTSAFASSEGFMPLALGKEALAQWQRHGGWHMGPGMMGWGYGMGWLGVILMAAFWIAVIVGVVLLIRWLVVSTGSGGRSMGRGDAPLEILKARYARGEINKEEFLEKKRDLEY